jgi:hypothetical protein
MKMTFQEIRITATGPCIANQLRDVNTICRRSWYIAAHIWKMYDFKIEVVPFIIILVLSWPLSSNSRYKSKNDANEAVPVVSLTSNSGGYQPQRFSGIVSQHRKIGGHWLVFSSGKLNCAGKCSTVLEGIQRLRRYARLLQPRDTRWNLVVWEWLRHLPHIKWMEPLILECFRKVVVTNRKFSLYWCLTELVH